MSAPTTSQPPSQKALEQAAKLDVVNSEGTSVPFGSIFAEKKTVVVFVRHFFCGMCQGYVQQLAQISPKALDDANCQIIIIGCGEHALIKNYATETNYPASAIYTDPSRALYKALGMTIENLKMTPSGQTPRSYVPSTMLGTIANALSSTFKGPILHPTQFGKQGNLSQLGGDFIFGPGLTCSYANIMQHTQDHIEVSDLLERAGVTVAPAHV